MKTDRQIRSFAKALSWRICATITTIIISYFVTHSFKFALSIGLIEVVTKFFLYYLHERVWQKCTFGHIQPTACIEDEV